MLLLYFPLLLVSPAFSVLICWFRHCFDLPQSQIDNCIITSPLNSSIVTNPSRWWNLMLSFRIDDFSSNDLLDFSNHCFLIKRYPYRTLLINSIKDLLMTYIKMTKHNHWVSVTYCDVLQVSKVLSTFYFTLHILRITLMWTLFKKTYYIIRLMRWLRLSPGLYKALFNVVIQF